jgi:predicted membrane-bound mannosyltransferase/DNA-binding beta-propeller fold protein YncE
MSVQEETIQATQHQRFLGGVEARLTRLLYIDGEKLAYLVLFVLAVVTRFWDLGARVMSHDESLHTRYSWGLYRGDGFAHTPLMHGPILFHMVALSYLLFGDNDFTARIYPAVLGVIIVMLPYFMRKWLGRTGALVTSVFFLISPLILYYSRYIREDMPALIGALIMVIATWRYIEERQYKYLLWLSFGQIYLFGSKEVSFIYVAIFGSFLTLYFIGRLFNVQWKSRSLFLAFSLSVVGVLIALTFLGGVVYAHGHLAEIVVGSEATQPADFAASDGLITSLLARVPVPVAGGLLGLTVAALVLSVLIGQWRNLRRFPELDVAVVMGTLILPALTPFLIRFAGYSPMDQTPEGMSRTAMFLLPVMLFSVIVGVVWGMRPPQPRRVPVSLLQEADEEPTAADESDDTEQMVEVPPDAYDWFQAVLNSRWWAIGAIYWLIFLFFFTTMFTNGAGIATGLIGSLGYWLVQQDVKRGNQPWYYYILIMLPIYEFLPVLLSMVAGVIGLGKLFRRSSAEGAKPEGAEEASSRQYLDLDAPIRFPVLLFTGYWGVMNVVAYTIAGEKMPWITTHLTAPFIILAGWVAGRLLDRIQWRRLWQTGAWALLLLIPVLVIALARVIGPLCSLWPANLLCNTVIPPQFESAIFQGRSLPSLSSTGSWLAAAVVLILTAIAVYEFARRIPFGQVARLVSFCLVVWLTFLTARTAWRAAYINYDYANEFLVYAHSSRAVKDVLEQIEEISLETTDGYGLRVAYDNKVSWPMSWYLRDYYNAVYYGDQPSRGLIGDAPVVLAGPDNWGAVEPLLGNRYYRFEYIRMWWPMQDYFNLRWEDLRNFFRDPALQRGVWDIFYRRDYTAYAQAVAAYRGGAVPNFELSQWPVAERMRVYIRKDVFVQVWNYGVAASEVAEVVDPYSQNHRDVLPELTFGGGLLNRPHAIALGPDGLLYVADSNNNRIVVFDTDGNFVRTFGTEGLAPLPSMLNEPWGVAVGPDGTVYVADTWNHRINVYTPEGEYLSSWGTYGPGVPDDPYAFWGPRAVAVDDQGLVYVADTGNKRIVVFDGQGNFIRQIGTGGIQPGQLDEPVGMAFGAGNSLFVADTWNQRIQVFTAEGVFVNQWLMEAWFAQSNERPYLDVDQQGNVYVTDPDAAQVIVFNSVGQYLYSFGDLSTIGLAGAVLADDAGHLFVVDTAAGVVQRYSLNALSTSPASQPQE